MGLVARFVAPFHIQIFVIAAVVRFYRQVIISLFLISVWVNVFKSSSLWSWFLSFPSFTDTCRHRRRLIISRGAVEERTNLANQRRLRTLKRGRRRRRRRGRKVFYNQFGGPHVPIWNEPARPARIMDGWTLKYYWLAWFDDWIEIRVIHLFFLLL